MRARVRVVVTWETDDKPTADKERQDLVRLIQDDAYEVEDMSEAELYEGE